MVVNTRTPKDTAKSVELFYSCLEKNKEKYGKKVKEIGTITNEITKFIQLPNHEKKLNSLVTKNHEILKEFDLSSKKLEKASQIFKQ